MISCWTVGGVRCYGDVSVTGGVVQQQQQSTPVSHVGCNQIVITFKLAIIWLNAPSLSQLKALQAARRRSLFVVNWIKNRS